MFVKGRDGHMTPSDFSQVQVRGMESRAESEQRGDRDGDGDGPTGTGGHGVYVIMESKALCLRLSVNRLPRSFLQVINTDDS